MGLSFTKIYAVAVRNFLRQPLYSFINAIGLASGLMCTMFICLWVNDELSKDKFHKDADKFFLIVSNLEFNKGEIRTWTHTPGPLAESVRQNVPEVELAVRVARNNATL
jgi:putative ABC transport system permease protein